MAQETDIQLPSQGDGARGFAGQWLRVLRDRINFNAVDARAKRPVRLLVAGSGGDALIGALDPDAAARGAVLDRFETAPAWTVADKATRAVLHYAPGGEDEATFVRFSSLALPVYILEQTPLADDLGEGMFTSAPREGRPQPGRPAHYPIASLDAVELRKHLLPDVVEACRDCEIALAAALPIFRPVVAAKLTVDCAINSTYVAGASALADHIPVVGLITGGIASAGDTIAITAMQMNMLLNIAAAYGKPAGIARLAELLPVIGGGYGWRALARELSGFIPGVGILVKAAIAYAGTIVVGHAASYYYETGTPMAPDKVATLYREATDRAKRVVSEISSRLKKQPPPE